MYFKESKLFCSNKKLSFTAHNQFVEVREYRGMENIKNFFLSNGLKIMMVGFIIFFASFITVVASGSGRYINTTLHSIAMTGAIIGFSVYVLGRISVFIHNKNKRRQSNNL
jgi:hypothetical protein